MKKYLLILHIILLITASTLYAEETAPVVSPDTVSPGDAFMITLKSNDLPEGMFDGRKIRFFKLVDESYIAIVPTLMETSISTHEIAIKSGTKHYKAEIIIQSKVFGETHINNLPKEKVTPDEESLKRIREERSKLDEVLQMVTPPVWDGNFVLPIHTIVTTPFGVMRILNGERNSTHYGIDYKAAINDPIRAVNSGKVVLCSNLFFEGNTTIIDHGAGIFSIYMHMSRMTKKVGYLVNKYDLIGYAGQSGRATGPHLHLSIKINGISVNPESVFNLPISNK
ncbi:MAG: M23 family metallopeptidase [Nitrospirae bacterium]|nr:M23 family metallopeptidase [Nitrospirota bacterium]